MDERESDIYSLPECKCVQCGRKVQAERMGLSIPTGIYFVVEYTCICSVWQRYQMRIDIRAAQEDVARATENPMRTSEVSWGDVLDPMYRKLSGFNDLERPN
jgi:hypothetical protein